jgi:2-hydroxychromene-2-carboxylate isomerase
MRGYLHIDDNKKNDYLDAFFDAYWRDNLDLSDEIVITKILNHLNIDSKKFFEGINNQSVKDKLKELTSDAFKKELFGVPTFVANNKIFWGQDRLEYAVEEFNAD